MPLEKFPKLTLPERINQRRRLGRINRTYTLRAIAVMLLSFAAAAAMLLAFNGAFAEEDVSIAEYLVPRQTVTEKWQVIRIGKDSTITVWLSRPEPMELGDEISFYCTFDGCHKENFTYNWQYGNGGLWTSFGSNPRKNTTYSSMLAGKEIRLEVKWK